MKGRILLAALALTLPSVGLSVNAVETEIQPLDVAVIGEDIPGGDLPVGETVTIDKVCDLTLLGYVADTYAMSIAAYERDENELFLTPEAAAVNLEEYNNWGSYERYKYKRNEEDKASYVEMYLDIGSAIKASSDEYYLLDIRMNVLNRMIAPMNVNETIQANLKYADDYTFDPIDIRMETSDTLGNEKEWLVEATDIPMLVERTVHFIFEVPKIVATDKESLTADFVVKDERFEIVLR